MNTLIELITVAILSCLSALGHYDDHKTETHYSTIFAQKGDKWAGGASRCLGRKVLPTDNVIAHRKWRCGTWVLLYNPRTERETIARVGDHGPYGACIKEGWVVGDDCPREYWRVKKRKEDPGVWKGAFDLTERVAEDLGHNGFEPITLRVIHRPRRKNMTTGTTKSSSDAGAQAKKPTAKKKAAKKKAAPKKKTAVKSAAEKKAKALKPKPKPGKKKPAAEMVEKAPGALGVGVYDSKRYEMDFVVSRIHTLCQSLAQLATSPTGATGFGEKNSLDKARDGIADAIDKQVYALNGLTKESLPWDTKAEINEVITDTSARDIAQQVDTQIAEDVLPASRTVPIAPTIATTPIPIPIPIPGAHS